jgi:phosphoglucosamine mutase
MKKFFGTDGVRGVANAELTPELAYRIGRCGGYVLTSKASHQPRIVIGRDTRLSGPMLESALIAGLLSIGATVIRLGVLSTPGVAYLTRLLKADAGVMISASHNPMEDNGIKFFAADGFKLSDEVEAEIERLLNEDVDTLPRPTGAALGTVDDHAEARFAYVEHLMSSTNHRFNGIKIALDCAHGAAYDIGPLLFKKLGAEVVTMGADPNGKNINVNCGSTHPERLAQFVVETGAHIGLAFDGDADRLIAVDETGALLDGDFIMAICGKKLLDEGRLSHDTIVTTVMSNVGFFKTAQHIGVKTARTGVGDRYVMEEIRKHGYNFGGEQSGHIIFLDYATTGDGLLSGVQLIAAMLHAGQSLSQLRTMMRQYPQCLVNIRVTDKALFKTNEAIQNSIKQQELFLGDDGRILVRASGTEHLIRVMAEGPDQDTVDQVVQTIATVVREQLGV